MTRIPCPSEAWDRYCRDEEAAQEEAECLATLPTVLDFCRLVGCGSTLRENLRAIAKYNLEHVWVVSPSGERFYYHSEAEVPPHARIARVGAGCIAWDGSAWEFSVEATVTAATLGTVLDRVRNDVAEAYADACRDDR
jgi:hypothetical protein